MKSTIDGAKHFSEIIYICYFLRGLKNIFCCSQDSHSHILAGLHIHVQIQENVDTLLLRLIRRSCSLAH